MVLRAWMACIHGLHASHSNDGTWSKQKSQKLNVNARNIPIFPRHNDSLWKARENAIGVQTIPALWRPR